MYSTTFEFVGLICFFIVNVMYSVLIGTDVGAYISKIYTGEVQATRWIVIGLFLPIIIALILNFTSSIFTVMTLGNLYSQFEEKGLPILLSPEYRTELDSVKGMFMFSIVLITILCLRMFIAPEGMVKNVFAGIKNIPDVFVKYGHFVLCVIVFGLTIIMYQLINGYSLTAGNTRDPARPEFSQNFKTYFFYLMAALGGIVLLFLLPFGVLPILNLFLGTGTIYEYAMKITTTGVPMFTFLLVFISIIISVLAIIGLNNAVDKTSLESLLFYYPPLVQLLGLVILFIILCFKQLTPELLFILSSSIFSLLFITAFILLFATKTIPNFKSANISFISLLSSMYTLLCVGFSIYACITTFVLNRNKPDRPTFWNTLNGINTTIMLSIIEIFNLIKGGLIAVALFMLGFTVKEYAKLDKKSKKYTMYNNKFRFDALFITLMFLLSIVLFTSFLNTDNLQSFFVILVEYMSPLLLLGISVLLIIYTNHLAQLSRRGVLAGVVDPELNKSSSTSSGQKIKEDNANKLVEIYNKYPSKITLDDDVAIIKLNHQTKITSPLTTLSIDELEQLKREINVVVDNYKTRVNENIKTFLTDFNNPLVVDNPEIGEIMNTKPYTDLFKKIVQTTAYNNVKEFTYRIEEINRAIRNMTPPQG
jgi:hypothetical protein